MQILRNLFQVGGDMNGLTFCGVDAGYEDGNTYVLATSEGLILFDCGCGDSLEQIFARMGYWGLDPDAVRCCFLTHAHLDHAGGAHLLKERGVELLAIGDTADAVGKGDERCCGYLYHKTFQPVVVDTVLQDGAVVERCGVAVTVWHVPGHSRGCTAYGFDHDGQRVVVSGDLIGTLLAGDFGWSGSIDFDKPTYIESLRRFARVEMDLMLPGHGMVYFHQPRRRVEQVLNAALMAWR